ncbi:hypothetical protein D3C80_1455390 [compost metagenome]
MLHAQPHALDVDADEGVELGLGALGQLALLDLDTGVVEGVVQATVGGDRGVHQGLDLGIAAHVAAHENRFAARRTDQSCGAFAACHVDIGNHYFEALIAESQGRRTTDTGSATGDQGNLAGKTQTHLRVLTRRESLRRV